MARVIVGTEIYLSDRFSDLWLRAAKKNCKYPVILFDNNPENKVESQIIKDKCRDMGIKYFRMLPKCLQCHSVDMLYWYAVTNKFDYFVHLDIDCPPLSSVIGETDKSITDQGREWFVWHYQKEGLKYADLS